MAMHPLKRDFYEMFKISGWSQAEAARQLGLTRGGVNGIITGRTVPSIATVKLFKLLLMTEKPDLIKPGGFPLRETMVVPSWGRDLLRELQRVEQPRRMKLIAAFMEMLGAVPKQVEKKSRR